MALVGVPTPGYVEFMTLAEIESAVETLPRSQQEVLFRFLADQLASNGPPEASGLAENRQNWLDRLAKLRQRTSGIVAPSSNLQSILDDIRTGATGDLALSSDVPFACTLLGY